MKFHQIKFIHLMTVIYHRFCQARQLWIGSPGKNKYVTWIGDRGSVVLVAQLRENLTCNGEVVHSLPAWDSQTFFSTD